MIVLDAHQDIAMNALSSGRDYREHTLIKRRREAGSIIEEKAGIATTGLPDALIGRIAIVFATLFVEPRRIQEQYNVPGFSNQTYKTPQEAYSLAMKQMDYYHRLADEEPRIRLLRRQADLAAVLATWADDQPFEKRLHGMAVLIENGDSILEPKQFEEWYERGVRIVGPAWVASRYCGGTKEPGGLTLLGEELLGVMANLNAILDLSHMAEQAFLEAVDRYTGEVVIASHSNPRRFVDTDRQLSDDMILRLADRDGVMGIVPYNNFLSQKWVSGERKVGVPFSLVIDAIDHVCQITGSAAHVGIGSDYDGGFGAASIPEGLDSVSDLIKIADGLRERGYSTEHIDQIMSGNFLRKLRQALPV